MRLHLDGRAVAVYPRGGPQGGSFNSEDVEIAGLSPQQRQTAEASSVHNAVSRLNWFTGLPVSRFDIRALWNDDGTWLLAAALPNGATFQILATGNFATFVALVPQGKGDRPLAASVPPLQLVRESEEAGQRLDEPPRVIVVVPGQEGHAQLWQDGKKLAAARVGESGRVTFEGDVVRHAAEASGELRFRVVGESGRRLYSGEVRTKVRPPWLHTREKSRLGDRADRDPPTSRDAGVWLLGAR